MATQSPPESIRVLLSDLKALLQPFFQDPTQTKKEDIAMPSAEKAPAPTPTITMTFNAPVGTVAQANAPGAQAAGRDINNGAQLADLMPALAALRLVIDTHPALIASPDDRVNLQGELKDIEDVLAKGERSDSDAKLVTRCLKGLKKGAEAIDDGSKILEKLAPVWDNLKLIWPALLPIVGQLFP
jgi:hypothetical protein